MRMTLCTANGPPLEAPAAGTEGTSVELRTLSPSFAIPPHYPPHPLALVSHLLGHEGPGSLALGTEGAWPGRSARGPWQDRCFTGTGGVARERRETKSG